MACFCAVQVRVLVRMPAWLTCVSALAGEFGAGRANGVFAADADSRIIRIKATRQAVCEGDSDTCATPAPLFNLEKTYIRMSHHAKLLFKADKSRSQSHFLAPALPSLPFHPERQADWN